MDASVSSSYRVHNPHPFLNNIYSDHGTIHDLLMQYKTSITKDTRKKAAERIVKELSMLLQTDDVTYIPVIERELGTEGPQLAAQLRSINRSILAKCSEVLEDLGAANDDELEVPLQRIMKELEELCEQHVVFEEKECLPPMQDRLDQSKLNEINSDYNQTKQQAPSKPLVGSGEATVAGAGVGAGTSARAVAGKYVYGSGDKTSLLASRDPNDPNKPERVQGQYGTRS